MVTVEVMEAALPPRLGAISRKEKPLHPYAAVVVGAAGTDVGCAPADSIIVTWLYEMSFRDGKCDAISSSSFGATVPAFSFV